MATLLDHYRVLGVGESAGMAEVTSSYKKLCMKYHPDVSSSPESEEMMKKINIAYSVIREKQRREAAYRKQPGSSGSTGRYNGTYSRASRTGARKTEENKEKEAEKLFDEYLRGLCLKYNMLSMYGMYKAVSRELYRQKRYGGALTFASISVNTEGADKTGDEELARLAAGVINGMLRETDIAAYADDGVFAILFVELKKKNAVDVISRLVKKILGSAGAKLAGLAVIRFEYESWSGSGSENIERINRVLKKFGKELSVLDNSRCHPER